MSLSVRFVISVTPSKEKIHPFSKMAPTFEPTMHDILLYLECPKPVQNMFYFIMGCDISISLGLETL